MISKKSIRTQLVISLIILSVIPLLMLGTSLTWQNYVTQQQQAEDLQAEASKRALNRIQAILGTLESELGLLTKTHRLLAMSYDQQHTALSIYRSHKTDSNKEILNEIALLDSSGQEKVRVSRSEIITKNDLKVRSKTDAIMTPVNAGESYYSPVYFNDETSEPFMIISMPVMNITKNSVDGVIVANVRLKFMWDLIANVPIGKSGIAYLTDNSGRVIAHPDPSVVLKGSYIDVPVPPGIRIGLRGIKAVTACQQIQIGAQSLHIVTERPVWEAMEQTYRSTITISIFLHIIIICKCPIVEIS